MLLTKREMLCSHLFIWFSLVSLGYVEAACSRILETRVMFVVSKLKREKDFDETGVTLYSFYRTITIIRMKKLSRMRTVIYRDNLIVHASLVIPKFIFLCNWETACGNGFDDASMSL